MHREELDVDGERTEVPALAGLAQPDLILLNDDDLAYAKVRLDPKSLATATAHLKDFSQSLPRTLVWGSAWDAARDGETPARGYVELILANIAEESDSSVILVQLRQLATTLNFYVAEEHKEATAVAAADRLWELASSVPAGSDAQLQFVKSFALLARSAGQLDTVAGLLDGSRGAGRAWPWTRTCAGNCSPPWWPAAAPGQEEIDAELEHDNTASGQNAAALAKAAIPTPEAKAAAWESIVVKGELSNALQGSAVAGFTRVLDTALLEPYAEKYFEAVPGIVAEPHPRAGPADRRRALPGAADHAGHGGPDGRVPGRAAGGQRGAAPDDAGKPRRRGPRPAARQATPARTRAIQNSGAVDAEVLVAGMAHEPRRAPLCADGPLDREPGRGHVVRTAAIPGTTTSRSPACRSCKGSADPTFHGDRDALQPRAAAAGGAVPVPHAVLPARGREARRGGDRLRGPGRRADADQPGRQRPVRVRDAQAPGDGGGCRRHCWRSNAPGGEPGVLHRPERQLPGAARPRCRSRKP